jgi:endonuclease/exonuclease/phosphatase (EEP) superfamily protein YafD
LIAAVARRSLLGLGVLGIGVGVFGAVCRRVSSASHVVIVAAAFYPELVLASVLGTVLVVIWALLCKKTHPTGAFSCTIAAIIATALLLIPFIPRYVSATVPHGRHLQVLTLNMRLGRASPQAVVKLVTDKHVDVLMAQELTPDEASSLKAAGLTNLLPYTALQPLTGPAGGGIWSRYPLGNIDRYVFFPFATVAARLQDGPLLVTGHMPGPWPQNAAPWLNTIRVFGSYLSTLRTTQGAQGMIVGGDFNATLDSAPFRALLKGGLRDAVEQSGAGVVPTYPGDHGPLAMIGIDHVLLYRAVASGARSETVRGSDHRGLLISVVLPS